MHIVSRCLIVDDHAVNEFPKRHTASSPLAPQRSQTTHIGSWNPCLVGHAAGCPAAASGSNTAQPVRTFETPDPIGSLALLTGRL